MEKNTQLSLFRQLLSQFVIFTDEEWDLFESHLDYASLRKKDHFIVEGTVCDHIAFIACGSARYYHLKDGAEITGYFSVEKELITSYKSFITRKPSASNIQVLENTELVLISHRNMQLMLNHPLLGARMERLGRLIAEYCVCCYEDRVFAFITQTPEERYLEMLKNESYLLQRIPQHYIANYLGITPVSLSRIRRRTAFA